MHASTAVLTAVSSITLVTFHCLKELLNLKNIGKINIDYLYCAQAFPSSAAGLLLSVRIADSCEERTLKTTCTISRNREVKAFYNFISLFPNNY